MGRYGTARFPHNFNSAGKAFTQQKHEIEPRPTEQDGADYVHYNKPKGTSLEWKPRESKIEF